MKIRTDFVTNSSSSSFTITFQIDLKDKDYNICFQGEGAVPETGSTRTFNDEINVSLDVRQLGEAKSVDELIYYIREGIKDGENYKFDESSSFIKRIRQNIKSIDDIAEVSMFIVESNYEMVTAEFSYDFVNKQYQEDVGSIMPGELEVDGYSGGRVEIRRVQYTPPKESDEYVAHIVSKMTSKIQDECILRETSFDGRNERIEKLHIGDRIDIIRNPDEENDPNRMEAIGEFGSIGFLPSQLSDVISEYEDDIHLGAVVKEVIPNSKRNNNSKSSIVILEITGEGKR